MGDLIQFPEPSPENLTCECGSQWWDTSVVIGPEGGATGFRLPLVCHECGAEQVPA